MTSPNKNGGREASVSQSLFGAIRVSPQPSRRMREQGVDQARLRGQVIAQLLRAAAVAGDFVEQAFELDNVAIDRSLEVAIGAIFAGNLVKGLLAGGRVEALGEGLVLAALVAVPHLGGEVAVHQPADVERQRFERIAAGLRGLRLRRGCRTTAGWLTTGRRALVGVRAVEQV